MSKETSTLTLLSLLPKYAGKGNISRDGKLGIDNLAKSVGIKNNIEKEDYIGKDLIKSIERGRKKRLNIMIKCYNECCKRIKEADKNNEYYIFFTVPVSVPGCPKYNHIVILEYISENLREKFLDTIVLDNGETIYVNWENLEANIENNKKENLSN